MVISIFPCQLARPYLQRCQTHAARASMHQHGVSRFQAHHAIQCSLCRHKCRWQGGSFLSRHIDWCRRDHAAVSDGHAAHAAVDQPKHVLPDAQRAMTTVCT
eukprot:1154291-Pelagomonas_calceolata.AAC.8